LSSTSEWTQTLATSKIEYRDEIVVTLHIEVM
jgi:hypothetical protein